MVSLVTLQLFQMVVPALKICTLTSFLKRTKAELHSIRQSNFAQQILPNYLAFITLRAHYRLGLMLISSFMIQRKRLPLRMLTCMEILIIQYGKVWNVKAILLQHTAEGHWFTKTASSLAIKVPEN